RNDLKNRMVTRRNGQIAANGMGTYTPEYRAKLLDKLLNIQKEIQNKYPEIELINNQELIAIQVIWYRDLIFNEKVSSIYNKIYNNHIDMEDKTKKFKEEEELLRKNCKSNDDFNLIQE